MWSCLPEEIILNILSRLQLKHLSRLRCVCKSWCNLLTSHDFVRMHINHAVELNNFSLMINWCSDLYSVDSVSSSSELRYEAVKIIDRPFESGLMSCYNGLLSSFVKYWDRTTFFIWNPFIKEYREISAPPITSRSNYIAYGFGYDCKIDDYKLVRIVSFPSVEINVYCLGSISWRKVQSVAPNSFRTKSYAGVLLNGALHWIKTHPTVESQVIVSFDIGDERLQEIELPNCLVGKFTSNVGAFIGDLCVVGNMSDSHDVWVMKDYGVIESWTRLYTIARETSISSYLKPIHSFKNGDILFWVELNKENDCSSSLVSYDPKQDRVGILKIQGGPKHFADVHTYVGSLVSPNGVLL